jgi:hypothetical protein
MIRPSHLAGSLSLMVLLAWAAWESRWQPQPEPAPPMTDKPAEAAPITTLAFPPLSDYRITLERPLFYPGRIMPSAPDTISDTDEDTPQTPLGGMARPSLKAVIIEHGERSALLQLPGQPDNVRLRTGESSAGWQVVAIDKDQVTVESGGRREQLPLRDFTNMPPPGPRLPRQRTPVRRPRPSGIEPKTAPE